VLLVPVVAGAEVLPVVPSGGTCGVVTDCTVMIYLSPRS